MSPMPDPTPADLTGHCRTLSRRTLADLFASDPDRFAHLSFAWDDWLVDVSKERLGPDTLPLLVAHATAAGLACGPMAPAVYRTRLRPPEQARSRRAWL